VIRRSAIGILVLALAGTALLGACKPEERDRVLQYEPGVYKGKPDSKLNADQLQALRARTGYQGGISVAQRGGGGSGAREPDVRTPGSGRSGALRARSAYQSGVTVSSGRGHAAPASSVRAPAGALRARSSYQGGSGPSLGGGRAAAPSSTRAPVGALRGRTSFQGGGRSVRPPSQ